MVEKQRTAKEIRTYCEGIDRDGCGTAEEEFCCNAFDDLPRLLDVAVELRKVLGVAMSYVIDDLRAYGGYKKAERVEELLDETKWLVVD